MMDETMIAIFTGFFLAGLIAGIALGDGMATRRYNRSRIPAGVFSKDEIEQELADRHSQIEDRKSADILDAEVLQ